MPLDDMALQRIVDFEKNLLTDFPDFVDRSDKEQGHEWTQNAVQQKRLLEENRQRLEQEYPGLWVGYSDGKLFTAASENEIFKKSVDTLSFLVQEKMPSKQQILDREQRQEFLEQTVSPGRVAFFRYRIQCADSMMDYTHGGYVLDEMYLPEFQLYLNDQNMFFGDEQRYLDPKIKKVYHGYLVIDRSRIQLLCQKLRALEEAREKLNQEEKILDPDKKIVRDLLIQQIKPKLKKFIMVI